MRRNSEINTVHTARLKKKKYHCVARYIRKSNAKGMPSPNVGSDRCVVSCWTGRSSGANTSSSGSSLTTSTITTPTGRTEVSTSDHQRPPNKRRRPISRHRFRSPDRPAATGSSTNTETPHDQPRHNFRHPQGEVSCLIRHRISQQRYIRTFPLSTC